MKIFGREPAMWLGLVSGIVQFCIAMGANVSPGVQTAINAVAAGVVAILLAVILHSGALGAALLQAFQGAVALAVGLGLDWSTERQGQVMAALALIIAFVTRQVVSPPVSVIKLEQSSILDKSAVSRR